MNDIFRKIANKVSQIVGSAWAFIFSLTLIISWLLTGPFFNYSDTWQLMINTTTTIITFLMVFLIQNTQNRESKALNLKLDELIRVVKDARSTMLDVEDMNDEELRKLEDNFKKLSVKKDRR